MYHVFYPSPRGEWVFVCTVYHSSTALAYQRRGYSVIGW